MNHIRHELLRLIALNHAERWVRTDIALKQLERFGERLIPGLIECLTDDDSEVRQLAVELLAEARPDFAVAAIIGLFKDDDRLVHISAIHALAEIGPKAITAVPWLEPWLFDPEEYLRVLAATAILQIDKTRSGELLPLIRAATKSDNAAVVSLAQDYLDEQDRRTEQ